MRASATLDTAISGNAQARLLRFIAGLQCLANLRQHLICQLQQDFSLRCKAKRLAFTHK